MDTDEREAHYPVLKPSIYLRVVPTDLPPDVTDIYVNCHMNNISPYLLRFRFSHISPECTEVNEKNVLYPSFIVSSDWWPEELTYRIYLKDQLHKLYLYFTLIPDWLQKEIVRRIFPKNRTKYIFYQCDGKIEKHGRKIHVYYATDYNDKIGYFWQ
ncbi:MAG: hypothetical protein HQK99_17765 [Nitrospirae bacterium]|nr:hypothetical protein [Nitrospirota bacterium]